MCRRDVTEWFRSETTAYNDIILRVRDRRAGRNPYGGVIAVL